jgi:hypothetical protein
VAYHERNGYDNRFEQGKKAGANGQAVPVLADRLT